MNRLARFLILAALSFVLGFYVTPVGFAQAKSAGQKTTLTGCLQKRDDPDEFSITGEDGKTYGPRSSAADLSKHLGHKVTSPAISRLSHMRRRREREKSMRRRRLRKPATFG